MPEIPTNLETYSTALNTVLAASDGSVDELNAINHAILTGEGIDQIIESFAEENPTFTNALKNNKDKLKKPEGELSELMEANVEIPKELAEKLGLATSKTNEAKVTVSIGIFTQAALKQHLKENDNTFGLGNLNSETIDLLCLLLCQESKTELIETLKATLKSKVAERANLSSEYQEKTVNMANEQVEAQKAAEAAKKASIFSAIFNAIAAVIGCIVGAIITAATLGAGTAIGATIIALSVAACVCTLASSGCQIAAICTDDPEVKDKLNKASMGLGICGAVIGLAASIGNLAGGAIKGFVEGAKIIGKGLVKGLTKSILKIAKNAAKSAAKSAVKDLNKITKLFEMFGNISTAITSMAQGGTEIASGILNIESAKTQRSLADIKIQMAKLDQEIETLVAFIDSLTKDVQKFMEDFLKNEQEAVETLHAKSDVELQLAQKPA